MPEGTAMASYPWALPNPVVLLGIVLVGLVGTPVLTWRGVAGLLRARRSHARGVLRALATVSAGAGVGMYTWGVLHLLVDESQADEYCKTAVGRALAGNVTGYDISFLPLRFGCEVDGHGTFEAVPSYVNPAVLGLALLTVLLGGLASPGARRGAGSRPHDRTGHGGSR